MVADLIIFSASIQFAPFTSSGTSSLSVSTRSVDGSASEEMNYVTKELAKRVYS